MSSLASEMWRRTKYDLWSVPSLKEQKTSTEVPVRVELPDGAALFERAAAGAASWTQSYYAELEGVSRALAAKELAIKVPEEAELEAPIKIVFDHGADYAFPRVSILLGAGAKASIVEVHQGAEAGKSIAFSNLRLEAGARADVSVVQNLGDAAVHFWNGRVDLARDAFLTHNTVALGGATHKSNLRVEMNGKGAEAQLAGVVFGDGKRHFDVQTNQIHNEGSARSDLKYFMALQDAARSVFTGGVWVGKAALETEAYQENRNLILSEAAKAESTPILEILTDAVRCKHGATAGRLSEDDLFYIMTRGASRDEARKMLIMGFFEPVLSRVPDQALREELEAVIVRRLG